MDGMTSGVNCRVRSFDPFNVLKGYLISHYMEGSVPSCVWNMTNLTVLHVAGNALTGEYPT